MFILFSWKKETILIKVARVGQKEIAQMLIDKGVDLNKQDKYGVKLM